MSAFDAERYQRIVNERAPRSRVLLSCFRAFWVGGLICALGQGVSEFGVLVLKLDAKGAGSFTSVVLVFLTALLTAIGVFDRIASYAGAGTVVPITGFANSIAAPAIEYRSEGLVLGVGAKLFTIAGPVLVYGVGASVVVGLLYALIGALG